jgi:alpha-L-fucosidase 2
MLVQSHTGEIQILPALPSAWPTGSVRGLRARGDVELDVEWRDGKLTGVALRSSSGGAFRLRYGDKEFPLTLDPGQSLRLNGSLDRQ